METYKGDRLSKTWSYLVWKDVIGGKKRNKGRGKRTGEGEDKSRMSEFFKAVKIEL